MQLLDSARTMCLLAACVSVSAGCYSGLHGGSADGAAAGSEGTTAADDGAGSGDDDGAAEVDCDAALLHAGTAPLRRLTRFEYDNTVHDLFGYEGLASEAFPPDENTSGFEANTLTPITGLSVHAYGVAARGIANDVVERLDEISPCDLDPRPCAEAFIDRHGPRAYRRPLSDAERAALIDLYDLGQDHAGGIRLVVEALLQSPSFLYRVEPIPPPTTEGASLLGPYALASRLSYFLWASMPDDALLEAASAGELASPEDLETQALRMLEDPRARRTLDSFHQQWLGLSELENVAKDPTVYPDFESVRMSMLTETSLFADWVIRHGDGTLETLLRADFTFADAGLAALYGAQSLELDGVEQMSRPEGFDPVALPAAQRSGLLTQGGLLATHAVPDNSDPIRRGALVRTRFFCQVLPSPPADIPEPPESDPEASRREQLEQHREDPSCNGCHTLIDPIGFGFEAYDGAGGHRTMIGQTAVDDRGELVGTDVDGTFEGADELGDLLAASRDVHACVATQWYRYAAGHKEAEGHETCAVQTLAEAFWQNGGDVRALLVDIVRSDAFRYVIAD